MIKLKQTCGACPESYDAFDEDGNTVGYLRLRHGYFDVEFPHHGGETIYEAHPDGDGIFLCEERTKYLNEACRAIEIAIEACKKKEQEIDESPIYEMVY